MGSAMNTKVAEIKCPGCGAMVHFEEGQKQAFCSYCGSPITIENASEFVTRNIDEADLKRAETERLIRLKELEAEEQKTQKAEKKRRRIVTTMIFTALILVAAFMVAQYSPGTPLATCSYLVVVVCEIAAMLLISSL